MANPDFGNLPVTGRSVCILLAATCHADDGFLITSIETLCSDDCSELGELWNAVIKNGSVKIRCDDLLRVLGHADQIVTLYMHVEGDQERQLVIEDSEVTENNLAFPNKNSKKRE